MAFVLISHDNQRVRANRDLAHVAVSSIVAAYYENDTIKVITQSPTNNHHYIYHPAKSELVWYFDKLTAEIIEKSQDHVRLDLGLESASYLFNKHCVSSLVNSPLGKGVFATKVWLTTPSQNFSIHLLNHTTGSGAQEHTAIAAQQLG